MKYIGRTNLFLLITIGVSFLIAGLFYVFNGDLSSAGGFAITVIYMFVPMLSVLFVEKVVYKENIIDRLLISFKINKWFFIAWVLPLLVVLLTIIVSLFLPGVSFSPGSEGILNRYENMLPPEQIEEMRKQFESTAISPLWFILLQGMFAGITINAVAGFGEELGWRGFLTRQFSHMNFWKASILIGFIWGIWHAPIIAMGHNYPQHPIAGIFMMVAWCILLSPVFMYITIRAKSVIAASVLHGTINAIGALAMFMVAGGDDLTVGITGLSGFVAIAIIIAVLYIYDNSFSQKKVMKGLIEQHLPFNLQNTNTTEYGKG